MFQKLTLTAIAALSISSLSAAEKKHSDTWLKLSIISQNSAHRIHMAGVDSDPQSKISFQKDITSIDILLDKLVAAGALQKASFTLKPELDIEESLITSVGKLIERHSSNYGIYVIREMMDVGTRQRLRPFDETTPVTLNVRMPKDMLEEFKALLKKEGFEK